MTEQLVFNIYCYVIVGFLGNTLVGWELGTKGWIGFLMEGAKNKKLLFVVYSAIFMMLWQKFRVLADPFTSWRALWFTGWGVVAFTVSHFLVPRSMRLYNRAKLLHETTYTGDWHKPNPDVSPDQIRNNRRLLRAEPLYLKALQIQKQLSDESLNDMQYAQHELNVAATYSQLALLYLQQRQYEKAFSMAQEAVVITESLSVKSPNQSEALLILSNALFRAAEIEYLQGKIYSAKTKYERSLAIDRKLQNSSDVAITEARLREIAESDFSSGSEK